MTICLAAAVCRADDPDVGVKYPLPLPKPGHISVVVVVGYTMSLWFVRNVIRQTERIAGKFGDDVGVELDFTPGESLQKYFRKDSAPVLNIPTVNLTRRQERILELDSTGTPMMYIMDSAGIIRKIQDGWNGVDDADLGKKPWLIRSASECIDRLQNKPPAAGVAD
jgi:hypothetical protein